MKIGILTHQYINNYGAFLQAWALREAIAELFPNDEVQIIDYVNLKHFIINAGGWFRFYKNRESFKDWMEKIKLPRTFGDSSETIENFGGNSSTGLSSRMIQLSGISWMLIHNAVFGLGASCHTRGKLSYRINGIWQVRDTIDNGYVGYFVEEGLLGGIACFSLFYSLLKSSWKKATFKNSRNMNNSFFLCFVSYVAVMLSVADVSQLLWVIIALYITYNAKAQAIASE